MINLGNIVVKKIRQHDWSHNVKIQGMINLGNIVVKKIDVTKICRKRVTESMNEIINYEAVYRTAPATPGLLIMYPRYT